MTYACRQCGGCFVPSRPERLYCSLACTGAARQKPLANPIQARALALIEDLEFLLDRGVPLLDLLPRLGVPSKGALERRLHRYGRHDLVRRAGLRRAA